MATSPIAEELSALEQARSAARGRTRRRRELAGADAVAAGATAPPTAPRASARDTRLEMALAGNAHYQAWKHVNGAIDALRATSVAQSQAAEPLVRPAHGRRGDACSADLPDDIAALLRSEAPGADTPMPQLVEAHGAPAAPGRGAAPGAAPASTLEYASAAVADRARADGAVRRRGKPRRPGSGPGRWRARLHPSPADPPEATVTFVVRETRAPLPSSETAARSRRGAQLGLVRSPAQPRRRRRRRRRDQFAAKDGAEERPRSPSSRWKA